MKNPSILPNSTIYHFDRPPKFKTEEQRAHFFISTELRRTLSKLSPPAKVGFLLQRGYFTAKGRFFETKYFWAGDKKFVERTLGIKSPVDLEAYTSSSISRHRARIREMDGWRLANEDDKKILEEHTLNLINKRVDSKQIIYQLVQLCWGRHIEVLSYQALQDIVYSGYNTFEKTLTTTLTQTLSLGQLSLTQTIANLEDAEALLTEKEIDQSSNQQQLIKNTSLITTYRTYHTALLPALTQMNLYDESFKYFSDWVLKSSNRQIKKLEDKTGQALRIACFVREQYYRRQDYAIDSFIKDVKKSISASKNNEKLAIEEERETLVGSTQIVIDYAKTADAILKVLYDIQRDPSVSPEEKNKRTLSYLESYWHAANPDLVDVATRIEDENQSILSGEKYYSQLEVHSRSMWTKYHRLFSILEFDDRNSDTNIIDIINYFKINNGKVKIDAPIGFLSKKEQKLVFEIEKSSDTEKTDSSKKIINVPLFRMLFFVKAYDFIRSRELTLKYSHRYLAEENYGIPIDEWNRDKINLIKLANLDHLIDPNKIIEQKREKIDKAFVRVNENIANDKNPYIKFTDKGFWNIKTPATDFDTSQYISRVLGDSGSITLSQIMREIDDYNNFSDAFRHTHKKNEKVTVKSSLIYATLNSLGCNIGHRQMSNSSDKTITEKKLKHIEQWRFSKQNISEANKTIVNAIQSLSLPTIYNYDSGTLHTSSDGMKIVVAVSSLLANFSFKYYGKESGVTANAFIDEKSSLFHTNVQSSSDREALYMLDGLAGNTSLNAERHMHSTDTHGYTDAIFGATDFMGVAFAPRLAKIGKQVLRGFSSKQVKKRNSLEVAPTGVIRKKIIVEMWDEMLRTMASIILGRSSAAATFDRLSRSEKQNRLYQAFMEYGRIMKTNFLLEYYDNVDLRQRIEKQLNRVELGQKLHRAVYFGRKGKLYVAEPEDMERVVLCTTLIKNLIIYWNYLKLSDALILSSPDEQETIESSIARGSVLSWAHVNMYGLYVFSGNYKRSITSDIEDILKFKIKNRPKK